MVLEHSALDKCPDDGGLHSELLNKVAIVKLNGGLGTSMGCKGPKSAIPVRCVQVYPCRSFTTAAQGHWLRY